MKNNWFYRKIVLFLIIDFFFLRERECAWARVRGRGTEKKERGRERERIVSRFHAQHGARHGAQSHDALRS